MLVGLRVNMSLIMNRTQATLTPEVLAQFNQVIAAHPYHQACKLEVVDQRPGAATSRFQMNEFTLNSAGFLHGGVLYGLLDVTAFLAAVGTLTAGEQIVTHDFHCSILSPVNGSYDATIKATVERQGKSMIFIRCEAWAQHAGGERKKIALATVTKSIVSGRYNK